MKNPEISIILPCLNEEQALGYCLDEINQVIKENHLMGTQITILTPFPGSRLRTRLEKENRIIHKE